MKNWLFSSIAGLVMDSENSDELSNKFAEDYHHTFLTLFDEFLNEFGRIHL
jgi:hypothetical protein